MWGVVYTMGGYYYYYYNFHHTFLHKSDVSSPPTTLTQGDTNPTHNLNNQRPPTLFRQAPSCMKLTQSNNSVKSQSPPLKGDSSLWTKTFVMYVSFLYKLVYLSIYLYHHHHHPPRCHLENHIIYQPQPQPQPSSTYSMLPLFMFSWTNVSVVCSCYCVRRERATL